MRLYLLSSQESGRADASASAGLAGPVSRGRGRARCRTVAGGQDIVTGRGGVGRDG